MRYPNPDDAELAAAIDRYVKPETGTRRYLGLLHGNFMTMDPAGRASFLRQLARSARQVSDHELGVLLESEWRSQLTASWLIGLGRRDQFRGQIGELLLASEVTYAGQGYCLALARLATSADTDLLSAYLDNYLPDPGKRYDQPWALGALLHIDDQLSTTHAARFLAAGGLWDQWNWTQQTPAQLREWIGQLCSAADEAMGMD